MNEQRDHREGARIPGRFFIIFYLLMGGLALIIGRIFFDLNVLHPYPDRPQNLSIDLLLGAAMGLAVVGLSRVLDRFFEWSRALTRNMRQILGPIRPRDSLIVASSSSLGEELLFRGLLLPTIGLFASSIVFGILHGLSPDRPANMAATFRQFFPLVVMSTLLGFAFGLAVEYTGSILVAVVAHFTINFLNLNHMYRDLWTD